MRLQPRPRLPPTTLMTAGEDDHVAVSGSESHGLKCIRARRSQDVSESIPSEAEENIEGGMRARLRQHRVQRGCEIHVLIDRRIPSERRLCQHAVQIE